MKVSQKPNEVIYRIRKEHCRAVYEQLEPMHLSIDFSHGYYSVPRGDYLGYEYTGWTEVTVTSEHAFTQADFEAFENIFVGLDIDPARELFTPLTEAEAAERFADHVDDEDGGWWGGGDETLRSK